MFKVFSQNYFKYLWKNIYNEKPSLLAKIFGMFEIQISNISYYYIVMENIFYGINPKFVYDLKGSVTNRLHYILF